MRSVFRDLSDITENPIVRKTTEKSGLSVEELIFLFRTHQLKKVQGVGEKTYAELKSIFADFVSEDYWYIAFPYCNKNADFPWWFMDNEGYELFFTHPSVLKDLKAATQDFCSMQEYYGRLLKAIYPRGLSVHEITEEFNITRHQVEHLRLKAWKKLRSFLRKRGIAVDDSLGLYALGYTPETLFVEICDMTRAGIDVFYTIRIDSEKDINKKIVSFFKDNRQKLQKLDKIRELPWGECYRFYDENRTLRTYYSRIYLDLAEMAKKLNPSLFSDISHLSAAERLSVVFRGRREYNELYKKCKKVQYEIPSFFVVPDTPIEQLNLSARAYNGLKRAGINTLGDISSLSRDQLLEIKNLGNKSVDEICNTVKSFGYVIEDA